MPRSSPLAMLLVALTAVLARGADGPVGRHVDDFALADFHGRSHALADVQSPLVVVAFLGVECPLAKLYAPRLAELSKRYESRGVAFLAIDANRQDSPTELAAYANEHRLPFMLLKDLNNVVADRFGAVRTPEVFVLDRDRTIRYWGRIDDQYTVGVQRAQAKRHDLAIALDELLAGREVSQPVTPAPGCYIGRVQTDKPAASTNLTWSKNIAPIFQRHCQDCHRPDQLAPFSLLTYDDVLGWTETIREVVEQERMPPWNANPEFGHFANDIRLSPAEKSQIIEWTRGGAPQGDSQDMPAPREFTSGWRIPEPDQIVYMRDKPFPIPAEGIVDYQWFYVNPSFAEDKWLQAVEARPGCRNVVHHITVYYKPPGGRWDMKMNDRINLLGGFNPGGEPLVFPRGMALRLPAGTEFAFEMHYTPNGAPQQDRSYVGLVFADPGSVEREVHAFMPADTALAIPPGEANYRSTISYRCREPLDLLVMRPHMHLRGKSFRYEALYPDGRHEPLLDVPRFDFNWQHSYFLKEPKRLPAGSEIRCTAYFDNSPDNPANPNPRATVRWGDQSSDEMMIGIFCAARVEPVARYQALATATSWRVWRWPLVLAIALAAFYAVSAGWNTHMRRVMT